MAKFIGTAGGFQEDRARKRRERFLLLAIASLSFFEFVLGCLVGGCNSRHSFGFVLAAIAVMLLILWLFRRVDRRLDEEARLIRNDEKGADGERKIIPQLQKLPDAFTVVCDLNFADSYGNIDHLVIGPTGVFSIDVKNWRGLVTPDGAGELLLNGRPTDKPAIRAFTARTMDFRERLRALTHLEPFIQCVFVFPHTQVDAKWGTTGNVHCINLEKTAEYIQNYRGKTPITDAEIARLVEAAQALKSLAGK
jgi:hypothetical protein